MSTTQQQTSSSGIGFCGLLTVLFIGLKLTHYINWDWKWVLAPMWIPLALACSIFALVGLVWLLTVLIKR